ncbi:rhodanese-like domain-containing protein [Halobacillus sp. BBL2006]|uniref:MBL fold metallo-hydrolase n=1 Tax=Halobacillus sp. BBL2006 TaxID=1543706 RepID=UPI0005435AA9|nr:MBL fold metallo-hydrolase [Halobacillus sp. BBL2006]KHE69716.1 Zn-dependent hydrolase [Halobacillus sp. BBL2006]
MFFKSFFDENLAQMSYMVGCQKTGEALIIDPARDLTPYFETAEKEGFTITKAAETHIHADFLSGARELANSGEVTLFLSNEGEEDWKYQYINELDHQLLKDKDHFYVGKVRLDVMHTPGHTPESISFVLTDEGGGSSVPMGIFTGDFVFVGDVGRPDLLEKAAGAAGTASTGAKQMFQSIEKFKELPDYVQVWPGHGAGSACGKSLGAVPVTTVGYEKENNWALQHDREDSFSEELLSGQPEPPKYFAMMKKLNKEGPALLDDTEVKSISISKVDEYSNDQTIIIDTRDAEAFSNGHLEGTINIPFNKSFANWAGWIAEYDEQIVLIAKTEEVSEVKKALQSIGLDQIIGYISATEVESQSGLETYPSITPKELEAKYRDHEDYIVVDVRNQTEWDEGHMEDVQHIMLGKLKDSLNEIPSDKTPIVHCHSGSRSAIAASVLQAYGYKDVINLEGGYSAWSEIKQPVQS